MNILKKIRSHFRDFLFNFLGVDIKFVKKIFLKILKPQNMSQLIVYTDQWNITYWSSQRIGKVHV